MPHGRILPVTRGLCSSCAIPFGFSTVAEKQSRIKSFISPVNLSFKYPHKEISIWGRKWIPWDLTLSYSKKGLRILSFP